MSTVAAPRPPPELASAPASLPAPSSSSPELHASLSTTGGSRTHHPHKKANDELNDVQELILSCNKDGMDALRKASSARHDPQLQAAFEQFKYAEAILLANSSEQDSTALLAVTCNNLGCYYKKVGKFHGALSYLRRALKMEVELRSDEVTLASTHLNICAIFSKLEKHDKAVHHALAALELMCKRVATDERELVSQDDYAVLALCYHSVAHERECFQQWDQAASSYQAGHQVAKRLLGEDHPLSQTIGRSFESVLAKAKSEKMAKVEKGRLRAAKQYGAADGRGQSPSLPAQGSLGVLDDLLAGLESGNAAGASPGRGGGGGGADRELTLPAIPGASPKEGGHGTGANFLSSGEGGAVLRGEATDWVKAEEALWVNFANRALLGSGNAAAVAVGVGASPGSFDVSAPRPSSALSGSKQGDEDDVSAHETKRDRLMLASLALADLQDAQLSMPKAHDMGAFHFESMSPRQIVKKTPLGDALDKHPEALMDIMDAQGEGATSDSRIQDFRPNRTMKRQTRTSRVVRRTGVFNSMSHRDRAMQDIARKRASAAEPWKSARAQKVAATKIQRVWRSWYKYCQENYEWMTITWICATMIQSHWRSYHVRRQRMDLAAGTIQRHMRGFLVRSVLRKHKAAVAIQRWVLGMLTRNKLRRLTTNITHIQRLVRGGVTRSRFRRFKRDRLKVIVTIQRWVRGWLAKRVTSKLSKERNDHRRLLKACVDLQRLFRGWKGRHRAEARRREYLEAKRKFEAANKLQKHVRGIQARKIVDDLRQQRIAEMDHAASYVRKVWLGARTRKKYKQLQGEFSQAEDHIVTIQRYIRGCMSRLKLWREAVREEEELWAAIEIQRMHRGYQGRVKWELKLEEVWRRETSAARLQPWVRGWLARTRASRMKRRLARAEFEKARDRFRSAQRLQALVRGVLSRKRTRARREKADAAAMQIQRIVRGRALRGRMWEQVIDQRATMVTALARGYLVRRRRLHLLEKVVLIQRAYRRWRQRPLEQREALRQRKVNRQLKATVIQRKFRQHSEHRTIQRISAPVAVAAH